MKENAAPRKRRRTRPGNRGHMFGKKSEMDSARADRYRAKTEAERAKTIRKNAVTDIRKKNGGWSMKLTVARTGKKKTVRSDSPEVVRRNKTEILKAFEDEGSIENRKKALVEEMDNVRSIPGNSTDYAAARFLVDSGTIGEIYNVDRVGYIRKLKVRDYPDIDEMTWSQIGDASDLYAHMLARDAVKLYAEAKEERPRKKAKAGSRRKCSKKR